ncbi:MAG: APC family permease [Candidatus Micrarchaeia archaeon]
MENPLDSIEMIITYPIKPLQGVLKKEMGMLASFSMGFADVGADVFLALGLIAAYAHGLMPLAILIAAIVYVTSGLAYAELAAAIPLAGGASSFGRRAFGKKVSFVAGWGLLLDYTIDIALFAFASAGYLSFFLPQIVPIVPLAAASLIFILLLLNLLGVKESSAMNSALTAVVLLILVAFVSIGYWKSWDGAKFLAGLTPIEQDPGWDSFLYSITLAMVTFVGIESISQGAEETKNPEKVIPRATLLAIVVVLFFAIVLSVMALGIVTPQELKENMNNPLMPIVKAMPFTSVLVPVMALAGFLVCFVSANTGIIGVSRVAYSMSKNGLISRRVNWIHPVFNTPWVTIIIFSLIAMFLAVIGNMVFLGELYAFGALTAYAVANISLIKLRIKEPDLPRPFKVPLNFRWKGAEISVISIIGVISCIAVFALVAILHTEGRNFAFLWFLAGGIYFVWYERYRMKLDAGEAAAKAGAEWKQ